MEESLPEAIHGGGSALSPFGTALDIMSPDAVVRRVVPSPLNPNSAHFEKPEAKEVGLGLMGMNPVPQTEMINRRNNALEHQMSSAFEDNQKEPSENFAMSPQVAPAKVTNNPISNPYDDAHAAYFSVEQNEPIC